MVRVEKHSPNDIFESIEQFFRLEGAYPAVLLSPPVFLEEWKVKDGTVYKGCMILEDKSIEEVVIVGHAPGKAN